MPTDNSNSPPTPDGPQCLEEVGRGHGGIVFRGLFRDEPCFVKIPPASLADTVHTRASFEHEALQLARLQRAGLPRVLHLAAPNERPYAVLALPKGQVFSEWLRAKPNEHALLEVAIALCGALCQLHALGYVHGELSPNHVFVSDGRIVHLLDQGSVHRRVPFDATPDLQGVLELLGIMAEAADAPSMRALLEAWNSASKSLTDLLRTLRARQAQLLDFPLIATGLGVTRLSRTATPAHSVRRELVQLLQRFQNEALGAVTMVVAPEGAGKTRLLADLSEALRAHGAHVLAVSCTNTECAPFSTIQRLLENHLHDLDAYEESTRARYEALLRTAAGPFGSRLRLLSERLDSMFEASPLEPTSGDARAAFIDGLADFLARYLAALGRSALIMDDLQHLDASSRMVLARLATVVRPPGQLIIGAMRSADEDNAESLDRFDAMLASGALSRVTLAPLAPTDARAVAAEFLGAPELSYDAVVVPLARLSDGTPLSLINLLTFALEQRLLLPQAGSWSIDVKPLAHASLPASSRRLIAHRLAMLDQRTLHILEAAAVIGVHIDAALLARVAAVDEEVAASALDEATSHVLMRLDDHDRYAFIHSCVCEALLRPVTEPQLRTLHQSVADALRSRTHVDEFTIARHLARGVVERAPVDTFATLQHAGMRAARSCDDALTLLLLRAAERAACAAHLPLDRAFHLNLAEACLRTGETTISLRYFEAALARSRAGFESAHVLGRIAWLHHFEGRGHACWQALSSALRELDAVVPGDTPISFARLGLRALRPRNRLSGPNGAVLPERAQLETLCELYALCVRMSLETSNPMRAFSALCSLLAAARHLPPCRAVVDAELLKAFMISAFGKRMPYRRVLRRAYALAEESGDPFALAKCHQIHQVIAAWSGDLDEWERQAQLCFDTYLSYIELGELCHIALGLYAGQVVLGKPEHGYRWVERAFARAQQIGHAPAMFALLEEAACAHLTAFERESEAKDLTRRLSHVQRAALQPGGYFYMLGFQFRVQRLVDSGRLGAELDALISEWRSFGQKSTRVHGTVALYYLHVAHARMHQCLRALLPERRSLLQKLEEARADLEPLRRSPAIASHGYVLDACRDYLRGDHAAAEQALVLAEQLAREQHCVWASYAVARLRAHMFKARGQLPRAREQARAAAQLARDYGPPARLRAICEEFELAEHAQTESPSIRQHLDALLHIAHASGRELSPRHQAQFVLNELLQTLNAERGFLFMADGESNMLRRLAARKRDGQELTTELATELSTAERNLVEQVYASGRTALAAPALVGDRAGVAVALVLRELVVGVIYLDRSGAAGAFDAEAVTLIEALANQVPVLLELAHALRERARLERNLREAQKMEAVGRLAGGIAHDFNNILGTIEFSASCLTENVLDEGADDLADIRAAAKRGAALTKQLTLIARGKPLPRECVDLTHILNEAEPMLNLMLRSHVRLDLQLPNAPLYALAEPSQIERLVMNLCRNASDAMPNGGDLTVGLSRVERKPSQLKAADHPYGFAELYVRDTGHGMSEETRARMFEPFYTTKEDSDGTGLGLAIVYAIVQQCEGDIAVVSAPGRGTTFRVYIPLCETPAALETAYESAPPAEADSQSFAAMLCVVDDDAKYQATLARALRRAGYNVLSATSGSEALQLISQAATPPELIISDMNMPVINGLELVTRVREEQPEIKALLISGSSHTHYEAELAELGVRLLHKPFTAEELLREVEQALDGQAQPEAAGASLALDLYS